METTPSFARTLLCGYTFDLGSGHETFLSTTGCTGVQSLSVLVAPLLPQQGLHTFVWNIPVYSNPDFRLTTPTVDRNALLRQLHLIALASTSLLSSYPWGACIMPRLCGVCLDPPTCLLCPTSIARWRARALLVRCLLWCFTCVFKDAG